MKIKHLILGSYETNCYIVCENEAVKDCMLVDTGLESDALIEFLKSQELNPVAAVFTHGHADHITGIPLLRENYPDIMIYIHKLDAKMLTRATSNLSVLAGRIFRTKPADELIEEADVIEAAGVKLEVFHTPGHTQGGISLYSKDEKILFSGDTLFAGSVGRTDMPGGNMRQLIEGIKEKLLSLPEETVVYPGHGPVTTIGQEKVSNPFLQ
ncbi:MAG: MBL fold metallo-hydrolase [Planctomycetota bacterium]|jgi:glyoxylase-like metal-dependent hydrolase (beta-lactamase superfamily II)